MINCTFYSFNKRKNSTALPSGTTAVVPILLKDGCNQEAPTITVESTDPDNYNNYNYCYIPFFERYYFVRERIVDTGKRLTIKLEEDYLGTARGDILSISSAFIEYSSRVTNNVIDDRIPHTVVATYNRTDANLSNTTFTANGCVIIGCTGSKSTGLWILAHKSDLYTLFDTNIEWSNITVSGGDTTSALVSAGQAVADSAQQIMTKSDALNNLRGIMSFPWVVHSAVIGDGTSNLKIGSYPTEKSAYRLRTETTTDHVNITIPWINNNWKRSSRYTELIIYLPLFGLHRLPVDELIDDTQIRVTYSFSYNNGDVDFQIEGLTSSHIVAVGHTNVCANLCAGSSNVNFGKVATGIGIAIGGGATIAATLASGGTALPVIGGIGAALTGAATASQGALEQQAYGGGGFGGFASAELDTTIHLYQYSHNLTETPANYAGLFGYPGGYVGGLSGLSGFTKLRDFVFSGNYTMSECEKISQMLNSGFYLE